MTKRERARNLYETTNLTLAGIAQELNVKYSTVRSWKYRDKKRGVIWINKAESRKRCIPGKSLDNLIYFKRGNYSSYKHGLYSKRLNQGGQELLCEISRGSSYCNKIDILFCKYLYACGHLDLAKLSNRILENRLSKKVTDLIISFIESKAIALELDYKLELDSETEELILVS